MPAFSPEAFAEWLNNAFQESTFKSYAQLAEAVKLSRSALSSYASVKPQTVTNKPSQPKRENVIAIATVLKRDVDEALKLAGYAPSKCENLPEPLKISDFDGFNYDELKEIKDFIDFKRERKFNRHST